MDKTRATDAKATLSLGRKKARRIGTEGKFSEEYHVGMVESRFGINNNPICRCSISRMDSECGG